MVWPQTTTSANTGSGCILRRPGADIYKDQRQRTLVAKYFQLLHSTCLSVFGETVHIPWRPICWVVAYFVFNKKENTMFSIIRLIKAGFSSPGVTLKPLQTGERRRIPNKIFIKTGLTRDPGTHAQEGQNGKSCSKARISPGR